jgi:hypothetical protein
MELSPLYEPIVSASIPRWIERERDVGSWLLVAQNAAISW